MLLIKLILVVPYPLLIRSSFERVHKKLWWFWCIVTQIDCKSLISLVACTLRSHAREILSCSKLSRVTNFSRQPDATLVWIKISIKIRADSRMKISSSRDSPQELMTLLIPVRHHFTACVPSTIPTNYIQASEDAVPWKMFITKV